eukprot:8586798-Ditylum_brightwellii.AAC.1
MSKADGCNEKDLPKSPVNKKSVDKPCPSDIVRHPDVANLDTELGWWIYCKIFNVQVRMRNQFRGPRWKEHLKTIKHIDTKAKQEFDKKKNNNNKCAKQSSIFSFVGSKRKSTPQGEISMMTPSSSPSIPHELPISTYTSSASSKKCLITIDIDEDTPE